MPKKTEHHTVVNVRKVPRAVRDTFKAYCATRGVSMRDALIRIMAHYAANNPKLPE